VVTLYPEKLQQYKVSPEEAITAVSNATLVMPSGNMWTGETNRIARTNATLGANLEDLMTTPIRPASGTTIYLRDIGTVDNGTDNITAYAHVNGKRTVYIPVTKRADASTLAVINRVKEAMPRFKNAIPEDVEVHLEFDQSGYVSTAIRNLASEGLLGAALTGLMVLLFLRDWRSALIVVLNIPFALFSAVIALWATGQTINIMTLGGLALAVGVLVDEATVSIENIHTQMQPGVTRARAVVQASAQTSVARLLSMLCVLAVFLPSFFMTGVARQLFVPLSLAVAFSMISSYLLSSSLVPVFSTWLIRKAHHVEEGKGLFGRLRAAYRRYLEVVLRLRWPLAAGYLVGSFALLYFMVPRIGAEIFPDTDPALLRLRLRAATGTRIEETERQVLKALQTISKEAGQDNVEANTDFLGVQPPSYPVNLIHLFTSGPQEAILQVSLKEGTPRGPELRERIRRSLAQELPGVAVSFEAADIVSQVMGFGSPTPVEVAVMGVNLQNDFDYAQKIQRELAKLPFLRDLQFAQELNYPTLDININRERAGQFGLTMADVARSVVPATSSSRFTQPNYWVDRNVGQAFQIQVQLPQNQVQSVEALAELPVMKNGQRDTQLMNVATLQQGTMPGLIERYNGQRVVSLTANLNGVTLGQAAPSLNKALADAGAPPRGVSVQFRGQIPPLEKTILGLRTGLLLAIGVIFLLLAANFQSMRLSLAIILTIPATLCGVVLMLWLTGTTLNVQSFMGAIMSIGIAVANAILLISFAEWRRQEGAPLMQAAAEGAAGRLRAVLMTATAMIFGMAPMAIGASEGGAQAAPLGRAVIGGLIVSTFATLTILPSIYAILQSKTRFRSPSLNPTDPESAHYDGAAFSTDEASAAR
jgi:multidrug efflux pump subunit AcrB